MSHAVFEIDEHHAEFMAMYPDPVQPTRDTSLQAERVLLSFGFLSLGSLDSVADYLKPEHFAEPLHGKVFARLLAALKRGAQEVDVIAVADELKDDVTLAELVGISHQAEGVSTGRAASVGRVIFEKAQARQLYAASQQIAELAFGDGPIAGRIDAAQAAVSALQAHETSDEWVDSYQAMIEHSGLLDSRFDGHIVGIPTGLQDLDDLLDGGLQRQSLVVIGARPGMGKTAIGMTIGLHVAQTHSVGFLSLEMPHKDVRDRQLAILSGLPLAHLKRPKLHDLNWTSVSNTVERARDLRFHVSDRAGLNILQVRARARALKRRHGLDVLVLDYIGLMPGTDPKMLRAYQIEEITKGLKALAKELDICIIALAQVNRGVADRADQTPMLSDLRDSGGIEQDADVVAFINRPIVSKPDLPADFKPYALLRIAKNRQGQLGDVHLHYQGELTKFSAWGGEPPSLKLATAPAKSRGFKNEI